LFAGTELLWLWRQLDVLTPSSYLWSPQFSGKDTEGTPAARAAVNVRMAMDLAELVRNTTGRRPAVMPYIWIWPRAVGSFPWLN
jgi:hypothetical protein